MTDGQPESVGDDGASVRKGRLICWILLNIPPYTVKFPPDYYPDPL